MLSYWVLFIKKINLLCLRHWCFSGKFRNFLQEQKQQPEVFCKNDALKDFTIFTEKCLCWSHFLIRLLKSAAFSTADLLKKTPHRCFSVNIAKILRTRIMKNIFEELFLKKLAASVLALLLNADYLLTGYELISKKIDSC